MLRISGYEQVEKIYESDTALVARAEQVSTGRKVILKILNTPYPDPRELAMVKREFEIGARLKGEGIIGFYDLEKYQNGLMIVQEDIGGASLDTLFADQKPSVVKILELSVMIADALGRIHRQNVIHKDINPSNIIWNSETDCLKIIDFGLASELPRENPEIRSPEVMEGTLAYMSPEQTGRMNRAMDYRTDLYSLGVTLYELVTGVLPFPSVDPLELVHCHIARTPFRPDHRNPAIFSVLADIIMKLLAKNAEDRYQSAFGLKEDLKTCLEQLKAHGEVKPFPIAGKDVPDRFQIPQKLYGREHETETLLDIFETVCKGDKEMATVSGQPGIGKSVVVHEIQKPVVAHRGFFVSGKFDQLERNIPYRAIIQSFRQLIGQILTENDTQIKRWKKMLAAALGPNGQVIVDIIPELEMLIGPQPELQTLPTVKAQNRFNHVFQNFIAVFSKKEHPLVLFLDDLQWADSASLKLVELIMDNEDLAYLFVVAAFRENDVHPGHPVTLTLEAIRKKGRTVHALDIAPLPLSDIRQLVADTVLSDPEKALPLSEAVHLRTRGNPFFTTLFLQSLYEKGIIFFDSTIGSWQWDADGIEAMDVSSDVVDLMADKIRNLPERTCELLKRAACIGNRFELKTLSIVCKKTPAEAGEDLWPAMTEGVILPIGGDYKLLPNLSELVTGKEQPPLLGVITYQFLHDRVQQAAYTLIPESEKIKTHLEIGRLLLKDLDDEARDGKIFEIVNQLNYAANLITDGKERILLAELNLKAGKKAMSANAWDSALTYLNTGRNLMNDERWKDSYDLMLDLHTQAANAAYLSGDFSEMEDIVTMGISHAGHLHDAISFYETKIQCFFAQNRPIDVVMEGLRILKQLGCRFPENPNDLHALREILRLKWLMRAKRVDDLCNVPDMHDINVHHIYRILPHIGSSSYRALPKLLPLVVFKGVELFLRHGNATESAFFIAAYGMILCGVLNDPDQGSRFGELALALSERPIERRFKARTCYLVEGFVHHWKHPVRETLTPLLDSYRLGMETGDVEFGTGSAHLHCAYRFFAGDPLGEVLPEIAEYSRIIARHKQEINLNYNDILHQGAVNLVEPSGNPVFLSGKFYDEVSMIPVHREAKDETAIYVVYLHKMILSCLFDSWDEAVKNAEEISKYDEFAVGLFYVPIRFCYEALALLVVASSRTAGDRKKDLKRVRLILAKLKKWADAAPMNHLHRYLLIAAELERVESRFDSASDLYDQAIRHARNNQFQQDEALILERYARFWYERNKPDIARLYIQKAYYGYQLWGAAEKLRDLEKKYPEDLSAMNAPGHRRSKAVTSSSMRGTPSKNLDIDAVVKISQSISKEIELKRMLENLIRIVIESAGAQRGILLLSKGDALFIEAEGTADSIRVLQSLPFGSDQDDDTPGLPGRVIRYVARARESLVIDNALSDRRFEKDPYIAGKALKSVLCMPVMHHGKLTGILYLENNLVTGAFTQERFELLKLLASQASISIDNARLYATLEDKIAERTLELQEAQHKIVRLEKEATEIQMAGGFAHEMRNALAGAQKLLGKVFEHDDGIKRTLCHRNARLLTDMYRIMERNLEPRTLSDLAETVSRINENEATLDEIIERTDKRLNRALSIVDEIMDYSRIGKSRPGNKAVSLKTVIETMIREESREEFDEAGISVHFESNATTSLTGDERHFYSIVKNLVLNARDAVLPVTDTKRRRIDILLSETPSSQILSVRDEGVGIEASDQKKIFDPFYTTKPHTGTGLGLGVVSKLTALYNGIIEVHSEKDKGTTFTLTFPIAKES